MTDLLDFKTKKDRDDFLIAITVILLFFGFFTWLTGCENQALLPAEVQAAVAPVIADKDEDGIPDKTDNCPTLAGIALNGGCPADADGDTVYDTEDKCPNLVGPATNAGCPLDGDKDGVPDGKDNCPELMGIVENDGCPADADGDGVYDINDKCPERAGPAKNEGCPPVKLEEAERTFLLEAMRNVEFQTGKADLKPSSKVVLDKIVGIMGKYKNYKIDIDGHTDNVGERRKNEVLSKARAKACYNYLVNTGIAKKRISYQGYGAKRPIEANTSLEGREKNRRVEFNLHY